jgi:hypothetical protein
MIDFQKYLVHRIRPLDIIGTTSFGVLPMVIHRNTWGGIGLYKKRAMLSTHTAITAIGKDGRYWIIEMDATKKKDIYISADGKKIIGEEEYHNNADMRGKWTKTHIISGVKLTDPREYITNNIRDPHVCWIGEAPLTPKQIKDGNEYLFDIYHHGRRYDYADVAGLWKVLSALHITGSPEELICSELAQRVYEHIGYFKHRVKPMTPRQWQISRKMKEVVV